MYNSHTKLNPTAPAWPKLSLAKKSCPRCYNGKPHPIASVRTQVQEYLLILMLSLSQACLVFVVPSMIISYVKKNTQSEVAKLLLWSFLFVFLLCRYFILQGFYSWSLTSWSVFIHKVWLVDLNLSPWVWPWQFFSNASLLNNFWSWWVHLWKLGTTMASCLFQNCRFQKCGMF